MFNLTDYNILNLHFRLKYLDCFPKLSFFRTQRSDSLKVFNYDFLQYIIANTELNLVFQRRGRFSILVGSKNLAKRMERERRQLKTLESLELRSI